MKTQVKQRFTEIKRQEMLPGKPTFIDEAMLEDYLLEYKKKEQIYSKMEVWDLPIHCL